jgi:3-hydroxyisobutyrate dehydrogenase
MKVGFVGLGNIGRPMAKHLARGGHDLTVFDLHRDAAEELLAMGASWSDGLAGVARSSEVVFTSLPGPRDVEEALLGEGGILSGAGKGTTVFDLSTIDPESVRRIAGAVAAEGVVFMDAPVSGGVKGAEEATLCVMVGGDRTAYDRYKPVLDLIGDKAMYCGENGSGAVCKIVNNLIGLSLSVLVPEALTLGVRAGVDLETLFRAVSMSTGDTRTMQAYPESLFAGDFEPGFRLDLAAKDVGLATDMGRGLSVPMELANLVQQRYIAAQNEGWGKLASHAVARIQEERTGVRLRSNR